ncbi:hypothetical protein EMCRGX_G020117 [Ephydatia muelleri]
MDRFHTRVAEFKDLLSAEIIDRVKLHKLCFEGCPDTDGIRATCWKLLLGYLPWDTRQWDAELAKKRATYQQLMTEVIINPHDTEGASGGDIIDHPLSLDSDSGWGRFFEDNTTLLQIDHDTRRLYPDISFFQMPTQYPQTSSGASKDSLRKRVERSSLPSQKVGTARNGIKNFSISSKPERQPYVTLKDGEEAHWEVAERILFVHAKTYPGIDYVQGMNEILGPIYYVFSSHPDPAWQKYAEADTFFCFASLMTEIGDSFTRSLDHCKAGISGQLQKIMVLLKSKDPVLHKHLTVTIKMDPMYFAFRWITLLLSQEFLLPEVIRLWDSFFADERRFTFLLHVCCAMMIILRDQLLEGDFSTCMKLLQHFPSYDIQKLIQKGQDIRRFHPL